MGDRAPSRQRLAAILAADAAGYSRLMSHDSQATVDSLDAARAVFGSKIAAHQGRVVDMSGDSVLAVFESATGAVAAAIHIQTALEALCAGVPADRCMRFRIGVHLGDIIEKSDGSIYGDGVNIAARLEGLATPGGIAVSDAVRGSVRIRIAGTFEDLGDQQVKNIADPVRAFRVVPTVQDEDVGLASARSFTKSWLRRFPWRWLAPAILLVGIAGASTYILIARKGSTEVGSGPPLLSVAVLPFKSADGNASDPFAIAYTQSVTNGLAKAMLGNAVVPTDTVAAYRGDLGDLHSVGIQLNVRYLVHGRIRREGGQVVVTAEVIDAQTRAQAWSTRVSTPEAHIVDVPDMPALRLLGPLEDAIYAAEAARLRDAPVDSSSALELAVRGMYIQPTLDLAVAIVKVGELCDAALRLNSTLPAALWCKARDVEFAIYGGGPNPPDQFDARLVAELDSLTSQAVVMGPTNAEIWNTRANALRFQRRWDAVSEARSRAILLNPALTTPYVESARDATLRGDSQAALAALTRAADLLPDIQKDENYQTVKCRAHLALGQFSEAIASGEKAASSGFSNGAIHLFLAVAYAQMGELEKAKAARERALSLRNGTTIARWKLCALEKPLPVHLRLVDP